MSTQYHVFRNDGLGGPVDYGTVIATTAALTWTSSALAFPGQYVFAVRAYDTLTGYSELNVDCRVSLVLDASAADITARPNAPANVSVTPTAAGGVDIGWMYSPTGQLGPPTGFLVYITVGSTPGYATPAATIPYSVGLPHYTAHVAGLTDGATYTASVRATNGVATETNVSAYATFKADATAPTVVDGLAATVGAIGT